MCRKAAAVEAMAVAWSMPKPQGTPSLGTPSQPSVSFAGVLAVAQG
jgi:hypothetical protein